MLIRPLTPADAEAYRSLMLSAYDAHPDAFTSTADERKTKPISWWKNRLSDAQQPNSVVLGALNEANQLQAVVGVSFKTQEKTRHKATLFGLYVCPEQRSKGLARQLVEQIQAVASKRPDIKTMQLTVSEHNQAAISLYRHCGFVEFGCEPMAIAYNNAYIAKLHMAYVFA